MGVTQNTGGTITSAAISNLLLVTGNYRRPGAGAYPFRGHNNVQGACDMANYRTSFRDTKLLQMMCIVRNLKKHTVQKFRNKPGLNNIEMLLRLKKEN